MINDKRIVITTMKYAVLLCNAIEVRIKNLTITKRNFFTDPTISTLTSGTPSQTVDLAGLSFPRRLGVRFDPDYVSKKHLVGVNYEFA